MKKVLYNLSSLRYGCRGDFAIEELVKMILYVILFIVALIGIGVLLLGKGGRIFESIRDLFRFGS